MVGRGDGFRRGRWSPEDWMDGRERGIADLGAGLLLVWLAGGEGFWDAVDVKALMFRVWVVGA